MIIITTTPITAIQMTLLDAKNPFDLSDFCVTEAEGPFACFWGASATGGKLGNGEMAGGGEGMIDVLNGFPSFLQNTCYHYKQIKNKDYTRHWKCLMNRHGKSSIIEAIKPFK